MELVVVELDTGTMLNATECVEVTDAELVGGNITLLLGRMELIIVELDTGAKLNATECAEVTGAELVGDTDLSSDRDR
jgi:hypothetical protein